MNTMTAVSFTLATIISSTGATVTNAASMPAAYVAGNFKQVERRSVQPRATSRGGSLQSYLRFAVSFKQMVTAIQRENSKMDTVLDEALTALEAGEEMIISDEVELLAATGVKFANAGIEVCVQAFDKALENANAREAKQLTELRERSIETLMGVITSMNKVTELKKKAASNRPEPTLVIDLPRMEMALSSESIQIEKKLSRQEIRDLLSA
ncbi:hypothetical protein PAG72_24065 [Klebsiella pneumoniae]|uniref:hypothetical protein n=1 Tax=Klebsiella pneumoniae complex TaxID=3390273 RepID=UPI0010334B78|nr:MULTISPECIES: hypothetical protein [Klebsiella]HDU4557343.1 hypothetical protein [Klebsiella pneumoniae subsp. pneumoniae]EIW0092960.1 hypothetical protein [Klebsiella pneumoniae]EKX2178353.1 hypothetical protein [Klebsiella pneumoniae]MBX9262579.1 hypothetical protein [Klebsiella pneumoniae]MBZ1614932.1 hypothetical protein [Klebsiella pneumoniae]